jgi:hypothetical protein
MAMSKLKGLTYPLMLNVWRHVRQCTLDTTKPKLQLTFVFRLRF